jgi:hypothetical protein
MRTPNRTALAVQILVLLAWLGIPGPAGGTGNCVARLADGCGSSQSCVNHQLDDDCAPPRGGKCALIEGTPLGEGLCCACRRGGQVFGPISGPQVQDEAKEAKHDLHGGGRLAGSSQRAAVDFSKTAAAAVRGQDQKEENAVQKLETDLTAARDRADRLGVAGKIKTPNQQHYDEVVDKLLAEGREIDNTAPCPFAIISVGFDIPPGLGAAHCTRITSDPLPMNEFGQVLTIDLEYAARGGASHLPFPAFAQLHSPDAGAVFSGECTTSGQIELSQVKRPTCSLSCDCSITTSSCSQLTEGCGLGLSCCAGLECEAGKCCAPLGAQCSAAGGCCEGSTCVDVNGGHNLPYYVCVPPSTTTTTTTSTSSTTTTTGPCPLSFSLTGDPTTIMHPAPPNPPNSYSEVTINV